MENKTIIFTSSYNAPDINSTNYWIDLSENKHGGVIKYFDKDLCQWRGIEFDPKKLEEIQAWLSCALSTLEKELYKQVDILLLNIDALDDKIDSIEEQLNSIKDQIKTINNTLKAIQLSVNNIEVQLEDNNLSNTINRLITIGKIKILDPVLTAINKGTGVILVMPSTNDNKILLPIWTGTAAEYENLTKISGVTYNIIDE